MFALILYLSILHSGWCGDYDLIDCLTYGEEYIGPKNQSCCPGSVSFNGVCGPCKPYLSNCSDAEQNCCLGYKCKDGICQSCMQGTKCSHNLDCSGKSCGGNYICNNNTKTCEFPDCTTSGEKCKDGSECCQGLWCSKTKGSICIPWRGYGAPCEFETPSCSPGLWCNAYTRGEPVCDSCILNVRQPPRDGRKEMGCENFIYTSTNALKLMRSQIDKPLCETGNPNLPKTCTKSSDCCEGFTCMDGVCNPCLGCDRYCSSLSNCGCPSFDCENAENQCEWKGISGSCSTSADCMSLEGGINLRCENGMCVYAGVPCVAHNLTCASTGKYTSNCCDGLTCSPSGTCQYCKGVSDTCSSEVQDCCKGYRCDDKGNCVICSLKSNCTTHTDCEGFGCDQLTCIRGVCGTCAPQDFGCGEGRELPCCGNLVCFDSTCQNCTVEHGACTNAEDATPCCGSLTCFTETCQPCTKANATCGEDIADCCPGFTCYDGTCHPYTVENATCGKDISPCWPDLTCFDETCQKCYDVNMTCTGADDTARTAAEDAVPCCGTLTCFNNTCQPCTPENTYADNAPDCCADLAFYDNTCQNCTVENGTCTDAEDTVPCCGKLICFKEMCVPCTPYNTLCTFLMPDCCGDSTCYLNLCIDHCTVEKDNCTDATQCCGTLTCFNDTCGPSTPEYAYCSNDVPGCQSHLTCFKSRCQPCTAEAATCGEGIADCCTDLACYDGTCQNSTVENVTMETISRSAVVI